MGIDQIFTNDEADKLEYNDLHNKHYTLDDSDQLASRVKSEDAEAILEEIQGGVISGLFIDKFDYSSATYPDTTTEVYLMKLGGSSGTPVTKITVNYTDATKNLLGTVFSSAYL